jgi:hypothetical protein
MRGMVKSIKVALGAYNRLKRKGNRERKPMMIKISPGFPRRGGRNE